MKIKRRIIVVSSVYIVIGLTLCGISGCATFKQTFSLSWPMKTKRNPGTHIHQCNANHIFVCSDQEIRINSNHEIASTFGVSGLLNTTSGKYQIMSFDDAKKQSIPNPPMIISIYTNSQYCQVLLNSNEEIQKIWECARKPIANTKKRTVMVTDNFIFKNGKEIFQKHTYESKIPPHYRCKQYYLSCQEYETANIPWGKLPSDTIITVKDKDKGDLYVKKIKEKKWIYHFLGIPASQPVYYSYKTINAFLLPVTVPYTCVAEFLHKLARSIPPPIPH